MVVAHHGVGIRWYLAHLPWANFLTTLGGPHIYTQRGVHGRLSFLLVLSDPLHSPMVRCWYLVRLPQRSLAAALMAHIFLIHILKFGVPNLGIYEEIIKNVSNK